MNTALKNAEDKYNKTKDEINENNKVIKKTIEVVRVHHFINTYKDQLTRIEI